MLGYNTIATETEGKVRTIYFNRPERMNAVIPEMVFELGQEMDNCVKDDIRVIILTGKGRGFCSGADIKVLSQKIEQGREALDEYFLDWASRVRETFKKVYDFPMPIIAAINGPATGGGLDLSLACDIRIASTAARLGETYVLRGVVPIAGGTFFLPRLVGPGKAAEMILSGKMVDAQEALSIGLVNQVVSPEELLPTAKALAETLASAPPLAMRAAKSLLRAPNISYTEAMATVWEAYTPLADTEDHFEGHLAWFEKRQPVFTGK